MEAPILIRTFVLLVLAANSAVFQTIALPSISGTVLVPSGASVPDAAVRPRRTRGNGGVKLYRSRDANAPLLPAYLVRPDATIGVLRQIESSGVRRATLWILPCKAK